MTAPSVEFERLSRRPVSEEVAERIQELVFSGRLKPGDRLPSEIELARQLGVSRFIVREALRTLEQLGVIEVKRGYKGGGYITQSDLQVLNQRLRTVLRFEGISMEQLFEARLIYEPEVARLAALRATTEDVELLEQVVREQRTQTGHARFAHPTNLAFHRLMARATRNPLLEAMIEVILDLVSEQVIEQRLPRGGSQKILARHEQLCEAIRAGDPTRAAETMRDHVLEVWRMLSRTLP
jgi:GntR family transcriptional repressor for pyruvate dehydrogenase complex